MLPIAAATAQGGGTLSQQALDAWRAGDAAAAQAFMERAIREGDSGWERHYDLARIHMERGNLADAFIATSESNAKLESGLRAVRDVEASLRKMAEQLLAAAKADLEAGNPSDAQAKLKAIAQVFPALPGLLEAKAVLPKLLDFQIEPISRAQLAEYKVARAGVIVKAEALLARRVDEPALIEFIDNVPTSVADPQLDEARKALQSKDVQLAWDLIRAFVNRVKENDYGTLIERMEAAAARGDLDEFADVAKRAAQSPVFASFVRQTTESVAKRSPEKAAAVLTVLADNGDAGAKAQLEGLWRDYARRVAPSFAEIESALRRDALQEVVDRLAAAGPVVDPGFEELRKRVEGGQLDTARGDLKAFVERIGRLIAFGPLERPKAIEGQTWTAGCGVPMRFVAAQAFKMGSPTGEAGHTAVEAQRDVQITRGYWIAERRLTRQEWESVMSLPVWNVLTDKPVDKSVELDCHLTYSQVMAFCGLLTEKDRVAERIPAGYCYTLPTEAEYELACRSGDTTTYLYGAAPQDAASVKGRLNPLSMKHLHAGIWDWCLDAAVDAAGTWVVAPSREDPLGKHGRFRVLRGGGRSAARRAIVMDGPPQYAVNFRLALAYRPNP